jgi:hypothetical protein
MRHLIPILLLLAGCANSPPATKGTPGAERPAPLAMGSAAQAKRSAPAGGFVQEQTLFGSYQASAWYAVTGEIARGPYGGVVGLAH